VHTGCTICLSSDRDSLSLRYDIQKLVEVKRIFPFQQLPINPNYSKSEFLCPSDRTPGGKGGTAAIRRDPSSGEKVNAGDI
jgi:hypothetical protein